MIHLRLLGPLALEQADGTSIASVLAQPKRLALLVYLAAAHPPALHSRDTLLALLWPESDVERARNSLRQALHGLRRSLGAGVLAGKGEEWIGVDRARLDCDAASFQAALESGDPEGALALFKGPLLDGFHVSDAPELERWIESERQRLGRLAVAAAWRLVEAAEEAGDRARARRWAERAMELAPYDEEGFRRYLGVLERQADRAAAVQEFAAYTRRLGEDLGLEPSSETLALIGRIRTVAGPVVDAAAARVRAAHESGGAGEVGAAPTPRRAGRSGPESAGAAVSRPRRRLRLAGLGVGILAAVAIVAWGLASWRRIPSRLPGPGGGAGAPSGSTAVADLAGAAIAVRVVPEKSVAVLPFENLSADPANAYLAAGIQDEILTALARIAELKVISRESVLVYGGHPARMRAISRDLGVAYVLEGSVQRAGGEVRVSVQLIDARRDSSLWASTYDRPLSDVFSVESEVARKVTGALKATLTVEEARAVAAPPTRNAAAYDAFLQGRAYEAGGITDRLDLPRAVRSFTRAVTLDPDFALAWARLAITQSYIYYSYDHTERRSLAAQRAVERAVALAPGSGATQLALGHYEYLCRRDYALARAAYERARAQLPNNARVEWALGNIERSFGHWKAALAHQDSSMVLDPKDRFVVSEAAWTYMTLRRFGRALELADRSLALSPGNPADIAMKAAILQAQGDLPGAQQALSRLAPVTTEPGALATMLAQALYTRDYATASAMARLALTREDAFTGEERDGYAVLLGRSEQLAGHPEGARRAFELARRDLLARLKAEPHDARALASLGLAEAGLGHRRAALSAGYKAVAAGGPRVDSWSGPKYEANLARIEAQVGQRDSAIAGIRRLLSTPYIDGPAAPLTRALLRVDPTWDSLRGTPAFQQLVAQPDEAPGDTVQRSRRAGTPMEPGSGKPHVR